MNFFQVLQSTLLKNEKKLSKEDANHLEIAWHSKKQKKSIEKREIKTKNEKKHNNNIYFFTFTFSYTKIYILKIYLEKLILDCYIYIIISHFNPKYLAID